MTRLEIVSIADGGYCLNISYCVHFITYLNAEKYLKPHQREYYLSK